MSKVRVTGQILKKCEATGYTVLANGRKLKLSRKKVLELVAKGETEGMVLNKLNGSKYIDLLPEVERSLSIVNTKHMITARVTRGNKVVGYKLDNSDDIVSLDDVWGLCFNGEIANAEARLSCKDGSKDMNKVRKGVYVLSEVETESL